MANSKILWKNELKEAVLTATSDSDNLINLCDNMTTQKWTSSATIANVIVTFPFPRTIDCLAIAAGNWADTQCEIELYSDSSSSNFVIKTQDLENDVPQMILFPAVLSSVFLIKFIKTTDTDLYVGECALGRSLDMPVRPTVGLQLGKFNNDDEIFSNITEGNALAATSYRKQPRVDNVQFKSVDIDWIRDNFIEFTNNHLGQLIWMLWDSENQPEDVIFGHWRLTSPITYVNSYYSDISLQITGHVR